MKLLALLMFVSSFCLAQTNIVVKNQVGEKLASVSIFETSANNSLISITDSVGVGLVSLVENKSYLFHLLGYVDQTLSGEELKKNPLVILQNNIYQLNEVTVKHTKLKTIKLVNKPKHFSIGESNHIKTAIERVTLIKIEKQGFLKTFKLFADQNIPGEVRIFRFIIFENENGKPGKALMNQSVIGSLKGEKMIFNLDNLGFFLNAGAYFIGYETQNNGTFNPYAKKWKSKTGVLLEYPMIHIKGKYIDVQKSFERYNLKGWQVNKMPLFKDGKNSGNSFYELAYELEMDIEI